MKTFLSCLFLVLATDGYAQESVTEPVKKSAHEPASATAPAESDGVIIDAPEQALPAFRDPTLPSPKILERLRSDSPLPTFSAATPIEHHDEPLKLPDIIVRAIVLSDHDHGVVMLECAGRKVTVRLSRDLLPTERGHAPSGSLEGFAMQGQSFTVIDFCDRSLLLSTGDRTMLIQ